MLLGKTAPREFVLFDISEEDPSWGLWSLSVLILGTFFVFAVKGEEGDASRF